MTIPHSAYGMIRQRLLWALSLVWAAGVALLAKADVSLEPSPIRSWIVPATRTVWQSEGVSDAERLVGLHAGQTLLKELHPPCLLAPSVGKPASILLDFGREIHGSVELFTVLQPDKAPRQLRVRFGESVGEAMAELGDRGAENDHAVRDEIVELPWAGKKVVGPTGFRFVRLDAVNPATPIALSEVRALLQMRDLARVGSFKCDDERLNQIWETGAYTVQLTMQEYLWDGIKRDRLVWVGDMHPEISTILAVFADSSVVRKSLDLMRDTTPAGTWMNGISSYSMWWVLIQETLWRYQGDRAYLENQRVELRAVLEQLLNCIDSAGEEQLTGKRFLDWPSSGNNVAIHAGLQALLVMTMDAGARLTDEIAERALAEKCRSAARSLRRHTPNASDSKQAAALLSLAGLLSPETATAVLQKNGPRGLSTFYGYYMLEALAKAGEHATALDFIRQYWGGMLDLGATTFWEDFDLAWTENAVPIDQLVPPGKKDIHGDFGAYCYVGYRRSLCHGWASGPTAWLSEHVLGISPVDPGFRTVKITPHLGSLRWVEGTMPTPLGPIWVRHERQSDGSITTQHRLPAGVSLLENH